MHPAITTAVKLYGIVKSILPIAKDIVDAVPTNMKQKAVNKAFDFGKSLANNKVVSAAKNSQSLKSILGNVKTLKDNIGISKIITPEKKEQISKVLHNPKIVNASKNVFIDVIEAVSKGKISKEEATTFLNNVAKIKDTLKSSYAHTSNRINNSIYKKENFLFNHENIKELQNLLNSKDVNNRNTLPKLGIKL